MFELLFNPKSKKKPIKKAPQKKVRLIAVRSHADWCEYSRSLAPVFENLKNRFDGQEVLFITLDFTNGTTKYQSELLAIALGISAITNKIRSTGSILLIELENPKPFGELSKLNLRLKFSEMVKRIADALKAQEELAQEIKDK